jgi:hypothetical protein
MPSSRASTIPYVVSVIRQLRPDSILDVGVGFGKWGYLFREYTDVTASEAEPERYRKENWKTRIEGIEGYEPYLHTGHEFIYDRIHVGNVADVLPELGRYDVIFFGDIIEHFTKEVGTQLLRAALDHAEQAVLVTTPRLETGQGEEVGNPLERHQSLWTPADFRAIGDCQVILSDADTLVAAYSRPGAQPFRLCLERGQPYPLPVRLLRDLLRRFRER